MNSLVEHSLDFKRGIKLNQQITQEYNDDVEAIIKARILDETFDDRYRFTFAPGFK